MYNLKCNNCGRIFESYKQQAKYCSQKCKYEGISKNKTINLKGKRFGKLTVLYQKDKIKNERIKWICKCDCGNIVEVSANNLLRGITKSCGCLHKEISKNLCKSFKIYKDLNGKIFNDLTVIREVSNGIWECKCSCGNLIQVSTRKISKWHNKKLRL